jgi:hypothetical protein
VKENEIGAKLRGLRKRKCEGFFIDGNLGGEEDGGGFAPTRLDNDCHGNLLKVQKTLAEAPSGFGVR